LPKFPVIFPALREFRRREGGPLGSRFCDAALACDNALPRSFRIEHPVMSLPALLVKITALLAAFMLTAFATVPAGAAEPYPNRVIKLIVTFPAGGPVDVMGRLIAQHLSGALGQQVIVDNRPGAGGTLAGRVAATAEPDGYTLLLGSGAGLGIGPALYGNIGYDPVKSFVPIAMVSDVSYVMIAAKQAPFDTVPQLLAYAKAHPGRLNFGVPNGAPPHVLALSFKALTGADIVIVPYKGASNAITDMIGGQVDAGFETTSVVFGQLDAHGIKALGVVRARRLAELPDTPTMIESGVPDLKGSSWTGVLAPLGTPAPIVEQLRAAIIAALKLPEMIETFKKLGAEARFLSQQEFADFIADDSRRTAAIIRAAGAKGE
jgi:tripartite-type tricarboxylate transporter receptor subunit TctC